MTPLDLDPQAVAQALHDEGAPFMSEASWCINAAAIAHHVMGALDVQSWPVQATVLHANVAYAQAMVDGTEGDLPPFADAKPGDPYCVWAQAMTRASAAANPAQLDVNRRTGRIGLPGHVLTWVPRWGCYLDPTAGQFTRSEHGIELTACAWVDAKPPPGTSVFERPDGGATVIDPSTLRGFTTAPAWQRRGDSITKGIAGMVIGRLLAVPPSGGWQPGVPRG